MSNNNNGPTIRTIPQQRELVCNGCKFLNRVAHLRGHDRCTDNYYCQHPDVQDKYGFSFDIGKGANIHFNHEGYCQTPDWCPLKNKQ